MMNNKRIVWIFAMIFLVVPIANAAVTIKSPQYAIEAQAFQVNISINAAPFDGVINLAYTNVNTPLTVLGFASSSFVGEFYNFTYTATANLPGEYSIYAAVQNASGAFVMTLNRTGTINASKPIITSASPSGIVPKDSATLIVRTNEFAICRFDSSEVSYESMQNRFQNTESTSHNHTLTGLSQGEKTYYAKCMDSSNYTSDALTIKFNVDIAPSAEIALSDGTPVKEGVVEVKVITSESLDNAPSLEYSFNDAPGAKKIISLAGLGSVWRGYMIITELDNNKVGTFHFSAVDSSGTVGTKITAGNIFVVDTEKPPFPQSVKAASEPDGDIKMSWYYDGEEPDHFNVYRTTSSGINYVDFYAKSDDDENANGTKQYLDRSTIDKVTYYYKVSAVDKAGNEGPLSEEVFATSLNLIFQEQVQEANTPEEDAPKVLPPNLVPQVDIAISRLDTKIIDFDEELSRLGQVQGEKKEMLRELKIEDQISTAKGNLRNLRDQLESYKKVYATEDELRQKLNSAEQETKKIEKTTMKDAEIAEKSDFIQSISKDDISLAVDELFKDMSFTQEEKSKYVELNDDRKDKMKVEVNAKIVAIAYMDGSKIDRSIVKKRMAYQSAETLSDVIAIETIPKSIAEHASEISFEGQSFEILKDDPVVKFGFLSFNANGEQVTYSVDKKINIEDVKISRTIILLSPAEITKASNSLTGNSIMSSIGFGLAVWQSIAMWIGITVMTSLAGYYFLFVKDYKYAFTKVRRQMTLRRLESENSHYELPELPSRITAGKTGLELNEPREELHGINPETAEDDSTEHHIAFINALINKAHSCLDFGVHHEAERIYPRISSMYQKIPRHAKGKVYHKCVELSRRIRNHRNFGLK